MKKMEIIKSCVKGLERPQRIEIVLKSIVNEDIKTINYKAYSNNENLFVELNMLYKSITGRDMNIEDKHNVYKINQYLSKVWYRPVNMEEQNGKIKFFPIKTKKGGNYGI